MRPGPLLPALAAVLALAACGDSGPRSPSPGAGEPVTIRGDERLGWDQPAAGNAELASLRFAIYVDGARSELGGVRCENAASSAGFPCSGPLPAMTPGAHTLELAAYVLDGETVIESPRSPPFRVTLAPAMTVPGLEAPADSNANQGPASEPDALPADSFERLLPDTTFTDIASVGVSTDGWLLIAERAGVLRALPPGFDEPVASLVIAGTAADGMTGSLVDFAVDPDFARTRLIYVLQTAPARDGSTWQLARYRQAGDVFGERAVLLESGTADADPDGFVSAGPDGRLYVALEREGSPGFERRGRRRSSVILRLNADGTTPADQPSASPVYAVTDGEAHALDWDPVTAAAWVAVDDGRRDGRLALLPADIRRARAGQFDRGSALPPGTAVTDIAFYRGDLFPSLRDHLLIAGESGLHRARLDPQSGRLASIEPMTGTALRALTVTPDGRVIVATQGGVFQLR